MSNRNRNRLRTVTVNNRHYKWRLSQEKIGSTLKVWDDTKAVVVEEWYLSDPKDGFTSAYLKEMIIKENL